MNNNSGACFLFSTSDHLILSLAGSRISPISIMSSINSPVGDNTSNIEGRQNKSRRTLSTQDATSSPSSQSSVSSSSSTSSSLSVVARTASPAENNTSLQRTKFVPLARDDDSLWLAPPLCLVRSQIEVVAFTKEAIQALDRPSFGRGGRLDRILASHGHVVGVRCGWCAHLPIKSRARGAISFPESISVLHQTVRNFKRYHFNRCTCMPNDILDQMRKFDERPKAHQSRKGSETYWLQSARELGLVDCGGEDKGICFHEDIVKRKQKEEVIAKMESDIVVDDGLSSKKKSESNGVASETNSPSSPRHDIDMLSMLAAVAQTTKVESPPSPDTNNTCTRNSSLPFRKRKLSPSILNKTAAKQA